MKQMKQKETIPTMEDIFGPVIYAYTRSQAIEDGVLIDVTELAQKNGFKFPVAFTSALFHEIQSLENGERTDLINFVLREFIHQLSAFLSLGGNPGERFDFAVKIGRRNIKMKSLCGPGDNMEPVITVMFPYED